ncbi:zinc finger BED domain-containing protein RICESLEEPER 2-like [Rosa rugosa]|uniref:zinc finger BED domain-containing protein RICESLEEPER 2-like n=1 Tax=Rosa rugosa TaxID=74645 RepID=UPI002B417BDC|nr:zinc finger BED domain-containing protein RICESLEEPER 2-like [Rosa rugosa]
MKKRLKSYKTLMFDGEYLHLRCCCHIINLIVKDDINELEGGIAAIWHCVKYIRSSSERLDKFREFSVLEHLRANVNVPLHVITRWHCTYLMLKAGLKYEALFGRMADEDPQFQAYFKEKGKGGQSRVVVPPREADWKNVEAFMVFLKKFYDVTIKLNAWKSVTSNVLFAVMIGLQYEIDKKMMSEDPVLVQVATSMKAKFNKYYGNFESTNQIIMIANMYQEYKGQDGNQVADIPTNFEGDDMMDLTDMDESQDEIARDCMQERMAQHHNSICNEVD